MKRMMLLLLSLLLLAGCGGNAADGTYQQITQEEAKEMCIRDRASSYPSVRRQLPVSI